METRTLLLAIMLLFAQVAFCGKPTVSTVSSYHTMETLQDQMIYELEQIEGQWNITRGDSLGVASAATSWWFKQSTIEVDNIRIKAGNLESQNLNRTSIYMDDKKDIFTVKMEGTRAFDLEISFDYDYSCYSSGHGTGVLYIVADQTVRYKEQSLKTSEIVNRITANFTDVVSIRLTSGPYEMDKDVTALARTALTNLLLASDEKKLINTILETELNRYYTPEVIKVKTLFPYFDVGLVYEDYATPQILPNQAGVIFYYMAYWKVYYDRLLTEKSNTRQLATSKSVGLWDKFDPKEGGFQIFAGNDLFIDLFRQLAVGDEMTKDLYQTIEDPLDIDFDVTEMAKFYPDIVQGYPQDTEFFVRTTYNNFDFNPTAEHYVTTFDVQVQWFTIGEQKSLFLCNASVTLFGKYFLVDGKGLDFEIVKDSIVVKGSVFDKKYGLVYQDKLNAYLTKLLNEDNRANPYQVFQTDIPLDKAFRKISSIREVVGEGLLIAGDANKYQPHSVSQSEMTRLSLNLK